MKAGDVVYNHEIYTSFKTRGELVTMLCDVIEAMFPFDDTDNTNRLSDGIIVDTLLRCLFEGGKLVM
jgi:hypothetical protein